MTPKQVLDREFDLLVKDLKAKHIELGMKASGNWIEQLEVVTTDDNAKILGEHYTHQLVSGRKSGSMPPVSAIRKWVIDKGIAQQAKDEAEITSIAWAIATVIKKKGTRYFQQGGTDLLDAVVTDARMQRIIDKVGQLMTMQFVEKIENEFKKMAV